MRPTQSLLLTVLAAAIASGCDREPQSASGDTSGAGTTLEPGERPGGGQATGRSGAVLEPQPGEYTELVAPTREPRDIELTSYGVSVAPAIDGPGDEDVWLRATEIVTLDCSSQREIRIKSVHTADEVFFLVSYPDAAPSETHKSWVWHSAEKVYKQGPDREDAFVLKWSLVGNDANLSIQRDPRPHRADLWFWKAYRTNRFGYADDKHQILGAVHAKNARELRSPDGNSLFLQRMGDDGQPAYAQQMKFHYERDVLPKYELRRPTGSRADIQAKGKWSDGRWTIEFGRKLDTTHADDIVFEPGGSYLFGVSCYEISGDGPHEEWTQPLYRTGDVFDRLTLIVEDGGNP
ncbi:MAG: hypothetical protein JXQ75_03965 [Phycisphaerae bacterium]|nr:hypothetical protein [Phycisphaerae bacterium]